VRAVGEDLPLDLPCFEGSPHRARITLGEILRTLDAGQELVEVKEDDASVRVWVE
jgi:hypothetical protein